MLRQRDAVNFVQYLLDFGADADHVAAVGGITPLMIACSDKNWTVATALVQARRGVIFSRFCFLPLFPTLSEPRSCSLIVSVFAGMRTCKVRTQ